MVVAASAVVALSTASAAIAMPASSQSYYAKLTEGGTFAENAVWETTGPSTGEHDKGSGQFRATASYSTDVKILLVTGSVTVVGIPHAPQTSSASSTFHAEGTHTQDGDSNSSDHGTMDFAGSTGTAAGGTLDDFDPNGDNLSWQIGYRATMHGKCQDDKFGAKCNLNTASAGVPERSAGGNAQPTIINDPKSPDAGGWVMNVAGGGSFYGPRSSRNAGGAATAITCHGNVQSGWNCTYAGTQVWTKAPGVTYTTREQFNARITITGKVK